MSPSLSKKNDTENWTIEISMASNASALVFAIHTSYSHIL
jgi:hypothetical protein